MSGKTDPFSVFEGILLLAQASVIFTTLNSKPFDAFVYRLMFPDRCPRCGYKWIQPVALLTGNPCGN